jgi:RNA polymerase sigma factor (sigma-70 family)
MNRTESSRGPGVAAVERVFVQDYADLVRLAALITGQPSNAEDYVQQAFSETLRRERHIENPAAYLKRAVVNTCRSAMRRRRWTSELIESREPSTPFDDLALTTWQALGRLQSRKRTALVLKYWLGMSTAEIAEAMQCAPGTVSSLIHRGIKELRKDFENV